MKIKAPTPRVEYKPVFIIDGSPFMSLDIAAKKLAEKYARKLVQKASAEHVAEYGNGYWYDTSTNTYRPGFIAYDGRMLKTDVAREIKARRSRILKKYKAYLQRAFL